MRALRPNACFIVRERDGETERKTRRFGSERETSDTDDEVVPNYQIADKLLFPRSKTERDGKQRYVGLVFNDSFVRGNTEK